MKKRIWRRISDNFATILVASVGCGIGGVIGPSVVTAVFGDLKIIWALASGLSCFVLTFIIATILFAIIKE